MNKYLAKIAEEKKPLNKPFRTPGGPKKFAVYVEGENGPKKVTFGDPNMEIKRDDPNRRSNFRARHNCDNPGPKDKARYWSCRMWEKGKSVGEVTKSASEKGIVIVDFDDTISDAGHRKHHVEVKDGSPNFQKFNQQAHHDSPNMDVIMKIRQLAKEGNEIVIMTGRNEIVRSQAIQWLQKNNVPYTKLMMRPASSRMKSHELKQLWLKEIDKDRVIAAIDDNQQNINMFKSHGIKTHRVVDGKIEGQVMSNKYLNKAMEKAAAKTLDEIDDDRNTSRRRSGYLPAIGTAAGAGGVISYYAGKKTGKNIVLNRSGKIGPQRGYHIMKSTKAIPSNLPRNALIAAGVGGVVGNKLRNVINNSNEEKYRAQRVTRRKELRRMQEERGRRKALEEAKLLLDIKK